MSRHDDPVAGGGATGMRTDLCGDLRGADAGRQVAVCGWVARRREHGEHLAFLDVRDHSGVVQCVVNSTVEVRSEFVVRVTGTVRARPDGTVNDDLSTGEVEVGDCEVEVLNRAEPPPFPVTDRVAADEVLRLRHRFVDLRRERMQRNLDLMGGLVHSQRVLLALTQAGASREDSYRLVQRNAMRVWDSGGTLSLKDLLKADQDVAALVSPDEIEASFDLGYHLKHVDTIFERVFGSA